MSNGSTQNSIVSSDVSISWRTKLFWTLLTGQVFSIPCYIFVFYHLVRDRIQRKATHNHAIMILLVYNFLFLIIDLSMTLDYYRVGYHSPFIISLCFIHAYIDYSCWYAGIHILFWISIERHILIFSSRIVRTKHGQILFHYIPLGIISLYAPILYFYLIVLCPCQRMYSSLYLFCGVVCFRRLVPEWFNWFEVVVNYVFPIIMVGFFSFTLIIRVIIQKRRLQRGIDWRRHQKMFIQLVLVSTIYLAFDLPYVIATIASWFGISMFDDYTTAQYVGSLAYVPAILLPYTNIFSLPQLNQKIGALAFWKRRARAVVPLTLGN